MNLQYAIVPIGQYMGDMGIANVFASEVEEDLISWALYFVGPKRREFIGHVWKRWATLELCEAYYDDAARRGHYPVFGGRYRYGWPVRPGMAARAAGTAEAASACRRSQGPSMNTPKFIETELAYEWRIAQQYVERANGDRLQAYRNLLTVLSVTRNSVERNVLLNTGAWMLRNWQIKRPIDSEGGEKSEAKSA